MSAIQEQVLAYVATLDKHLDAFPILKHLEEHSKVPKAYIGLSSAAIYFFLIFINVGGIGQLLSNILGFVVPGYYSLIALETKSKNDDTQLLTYWVVFAFFSVIEFWSKTILYWVPFWFLFKSVFLLYIGVPQFGGANVVYTTLIRPIGQKLISSGTSSKLQKEVDAAAASVSSKSSRKSHKSTGVDL